MSFPSFALACFPRFLVAVIATTIFVGSSFAAFAVPPNDGFVTDAAGVLTANQKTSIDALLADYRKQTSNEIAILLLKSLGGESIEEVGLQVGRAWGIGAKQKNNGILMLFALEERQTRIEVGYGLEGAVPDIVAKGVIDQEIVPKFKDGQYYEGLVAATEALKKHIGGEYTAERYETEGGGNWSVFLFLGFIGIDILAAFLGRTKSWWMGGVLGGVLGFVLLLIFGWWLAIPGLIILGLIFDWIVSRIRPSHGSFRGGHWGGGRFGGGGRGGGFGGGSFGGGGASGRW